MKLRVAIAAFLLASCTAGTTAVTTPSTVTTPPVTTTTVPTTLPAPTTTTTILPSPPRRDRIVIHGVGDIVLCNCFHDAFRDSGYEIAFSGMDGLFLRDALTIGNLECAAADGGRLLSDKPNSFRCDTAALPVMAAAGFDVAAMGNNHSADYGFKAMLVARQNLDAAGLHPVGAGANLEEATRAVFFERGGWTIAVVSFSGVSGLTYMPAYPPGPELINPWFAETDTPGISPARFETMTEVVTALDQVADIVIVSLHQGEYNETPTPTDLEVRRGHALVDAGADAVIAHHHHRLLPLEVYRDRPIFWGMGNFVWARLDADRSTTAVAEVIVEPDGSISGRLIPAFIESHAHPVLRGLPDHTLWTDRVPIR